MRYEIEECCTGQLRRHAKSLLANTATVNGSARARYRLAVKNVVDRLTCGPH
jgi:hypothetical protein